MPIMTGLQWGETLPTAFFGAPPSIETGAGWPVITPLVGRRLLREAGIQADPAARSRFYDQPCCSKHRNDLAARDRRRGPCRWAGRRWKQHRGVPVAVVEFGMATEKMLASLLSTLTKSMPRNGLKVASPMRFQWNRSSDTAKTK